MSFFDRGLEIIDGWKSVVDQSIKEAFERYGFVVIDYIRNKQLFQEGEDKHGEKIQSRFLPGGTAYARLTVKLKQAKGDPYDRVTWRDSGDLYRSLQLIIGESEVTLFVNSPHLASLEMRYGEEVLGLQQQYLNEFIEVYIMPTIKQNIGDTFTRV